ncbi:MAG: hypothetical protein A3E83_00870 [Gammaproteobacteria bacterium RIFCSPHIGHO2_12_FULL_41_20]|nr:MAG: hypothetical protein A3E83_00870 [Gammaproteobacteria bacterium RIFCSPHIGHO2_12_FULL_41_20]
MQARNDDMDYFSEHTVYYAPKPRISTPWTTWAKRIIARLFFPPLLLWDLLKFAVRQLAGKKVGNLVFLAQNRPLEQVELPELSKFLSRKKIKIITHDHAELDTMEIQNENNTEGKYIVYFPGATATMESALEFTQEYAQQFQCHVVIGNFRGVQYSAGKAKSMQDLVTDGIAQVQRLIDQGVPADKITIVGYSFGGAVGAEVARYFHQQKQKVSLFCDRTFSNMGNVITGWIRGGGSLRPFRPPETGHKETRVGKVLGFLLKPFFKFILYLTQWQSNTVEAFRSIPASHKEYIVVRSSKQDRQHSSHPPADDHIIPHYSSLHAALKPERQQQKTRIDARIQHIQASADKVTWTTALIHNKLGETVEPLKTAREAFKDRKMEAVNPQEQQENAHFLRWSQLQSRGTRASANNFFLRFFNREQPMSQQPALAAAPSSGVYYGSTAAR